MSKISFILPVKDTEPCKELSVGPDNAVSIATRYGLDVPGFEFRWGRDFPHVSRAALGPPSHL